MFWIFDHVRTRRAAGKVQRHASVAAGVSGSVVFDDELARLRHDWVESHHRFRSAPPSERDRAIRAVHASASAYFDYADKIRVQEHVPPQVRHGRASSSPAGARSSLRLVPSS